MGRKKKDKSLSENKQTKLISVALDLNIAERLHEYKELKGVSASKIVSDFIIEKMLSDEIQQELERLILIRKTHLNKMEKLNKWFVIKK